MIARKKLKKTSQQGASLIEIMITVLVVSIGLLGLASLQLRSMSLSNTSNQRQQAINLAHDISDRIFVNGAGASAGTYTIAALGTAAPAAAINVATSDIMRWRAIAALFQGDFTIDDPQAANNYTITICWLDKNFTTVGGNPLCTNQLMDAFEMEASRR